MFTIVNGCPLSGKSEYVYNGIINSLAQGREVILLTPEQQLVSAERAIANRIDAKDSLRIEVLSFRRLANRVFREHGGLCYNYFKQGSDFLMMWKAIMSVSPFLSLYKNINPGDISSIAMFLSLEKSFARSGFELSQISDITEGEIGDKNPRLAQKLKDLALIFSVYRSFFAEKYTDPENDITRLASSDFCASFFDGKDVYIDSFNSFTGSEYRVVEKILKGALNTTITVNSLPDDERNCNSKTHNCRKMLKKLAFKQDCDVNYVNLKRDNTLAEDLEHLQKNIFSDDKQKYKGEVNNIKIICAPDPMAEIENVFEDILDYVKNKGGRYKDCVICAADIDGYSGIIKGVSDMLDIPCFTSKRYDLSGRAAIRAVKLIPILYKHSFLPDDVIEFVKTGFSGIDEEDGLVFEEYIRTWNISGKKRYCTEWKMNPDGRVEEFSEDGRCTLERVNEIRCRFIKPLLNFEKRLECCQEVSVGKYLQSMTELLCELDFAGRLNELANKARETGDKVSQRQHSHTWEQICNCFDAIYESVSELSCSHENFSMLFDAVVASNDTGIIPTSLDEVLTGNALMLRPENAKRIYILGVNDGVFPENSGNSGALFTDSEINVLKEFELDIGDDVEQKLYDDLFSFYSIASVAREYLQVSYHSADLSGKASLSSTIIHELTEIFENIKIQNTKEKSLSSLLYMMEAGEETNNALNDNTISQENIERIYNGTLNLSQSKIDRFVMCPFSYNCQYVLGLREEKTHEVKQDLFGTIIHMVLEKFLRKASLQKEGIGNVDRDEAERIVNEIIDDYADRSGCNDEDDIRIKHLLRRVKYTVLLLVCDIRDEFKESKFVPVAFEVPVGFAPGDDGGAYVPAAEIKLEDGSRAVIRGYIDRLDCYKNDSGVYLRIVDYKTGEKNLTADDISKGLNIQMLLYMKCICSGQSPSIDALTGKESADAYIPAAVLYHISKRPKALNGEITWVKRNGILLSDKKILGAMDPDGKGRFIPYKEDSRARKNNLVEKEEFEAMLDGVFDTVRNVACDINRGVADISPLKDSGHDGCKYCKMYPICRRENNLDALNDDE